MINKNFIKINSTERAFFIILHAYARSKKFILFSSHSDHIFLKEKKPNKH